MTEVTIRIPDSIDIKKISDEIVYKALAIAIEKRKKELLRDLKRVEKVMYAIISREFYIHNQ